MKYIPYIILTAVTAFFAWFLFFRKAIATPDPRNIGYQRPLELINAPTDLTLPGVDLTVQQVATAAEQQALGISTPAGFAGYRGSKKFYQY